MNATTAAAITDAAPRWTGVVRAAAATDRDALRLFLAGLSPISLTTRFHGAGFRATEDMLDLLLCRTVAGRALVLEYRDEIIGHAVWSYLPRRRDAADVGVLLAERWHGCGLGSLLTDALIEDAAAHGVGQLVLPVLMADRPTRRLVHRLLPDAEGTHDGHSIEFWACIDDRAA